jgi:predicted RND superfamily exporter protein
MSSLFIATVLRLRWLLILLSLLCVVLAGFGMQRIVVLSDYKSFIDPQFPGMIELEEVEALFTENNRLLIAVAPDDGMVFKADTIQLIQHITEQAWLAPFLSRVDSITNYQHTEVEGDELIVGSLFADGEPISQPVLDFAQAITQRDPEIKHTLISSQLHVAVLNLTFEFPDSVTGSAATQQSVQHIYQLIEASKLAYPGHRIYVTGPLTVDYALGKYGNEDNATLIPAMLALMALILLVMTQSLSNVIAAAIVVVATGISTMGLLGWIGWTIDPGSALSPIVIMTLAVADSIHIIEGFQKALRQGLDKIAAVASSIRENIVPVFLTSLTTVLGVITFTFTDLLSLQRIGISVALGVTIAFILSVTLLPAVLSLLPAKVVAERLRSRLFSCIGEITIRHYRLITVLSLLVAVTLMALAPLNRFNDSPAAMLASYTPERQGVDFFEQNVSGITNLDVAVFSDIPGGVNNPAFLARIEQYVDWQMAQAETDHINSLTNTYKRLNQNMHGDDADWYKLPDQQPLAAQYLLLYEMSLPYGLDLNNQLDADKSAIRLSVVVNGGDSQLVYENKVRIQQWFASHAPELRVMVTGSITLVSEMSYVHLIPSMMKGGVVAILMVSLVLMFALRRFKLGLLGMLANVVPVTMGYGVWYLLNGQVNFIVASVAGVCLGVVVDFAVHFLSKYQRQRNAGDSPEQAIRATFASTARPLWTTMVVLVSGFWLLMLSAITLNFSMGCLTGIIILLALAFNFFTLPALLMLFDNKPLPVRVALSGTDTQASVSS